MESIDPSNCVAVVMAAGKSTRMKSDVPKVLHELCGQPILTHVLRAIDEAGIRRKIVVVGYQADLVRARFLDTPGVEFVEQTEQKGTGHAVMTAAELLARHDGPVLVIAGDQPMLRGEMIADMIERYAATGARAFLATAIVKDPFGLGRIVRGPSGEFERIVEQRDATPEEQRICEINPSFYLFDGPSLFAALRSIQPNNAQGEYYLTDVPGVMSHHGLKVVAEPLADATDMLGVNHRRHLSEAHAALQERIQRRFMDAGVTIVDPGNTYIDARAQIGRDTIIFPFTVIHGPVKIGDRCRIGPFAHVREESVLGDGVQVGAFVEVVRARMGNETVAKHLAYLGDAMLGERVSVGAGVITANFDGARKNPTRVDDDAFLGSGAVLVAPVVIGESAVIGAGAVLTKNHDVLPGEQVVGVPARPMKKKS